VEAAGRTDGEGDTVVDINTETLLCEIVGRTLKAAFFSDGT
jgi:hypothetical protein